jgi:hypothetical protein
MVHQLSFIKYPLPDGSRDVYMDIRIFSVVFPLSFIKYPLPDCPNRCLNGYQDILCSMSTRFHKVSTSRWPWRCLHMDIRIFSVVS